MLFQQLKECLVVENEHDYQKIIINIELKTENVKMNKSLYIKYY